MHRTNGPLPTHFRVGPVPEETDLERETECSRQGQNHSITMSLSRRLLSKISLIASLWLLADTATPSEAFAPAPSSLGRLLPSVERSTTRRLSVVLEPSSSLLLAETQAWVPPVAAVLDPVLNYMSFAMLARVVLSWYPDFKQEDNQWTVLVTAPTEPLLQAVKDLIPPAFGVDITPVVWLAFFTFVHEILLGQQGLLTMKLKYGL